MVSQYILRKKTGYTFVSAAREPAQLPSASVSNVAEVQYDDSDAVGYGVTLTAMADSTGNTHYEYFKKPATE